MYINVNRRIHKVVKDYFYLEEYKLLEERVLEIVRELKPELKDQL